MARKQNPVNTRKTNTPSPNLFASTRDEEPDEPQEPVMPRFKRTYYLPGDLITRLNHLQAHEGDPATGTRPDLSDLVAEALREYINARMPTEDGGTS